MIGLGNVEEGRATVKPKRKKARKRVILKPPYKNIN